MRVKLFVYIILFVTFFVGADEYQFSGDSSFSVIREGEEETRIEGNVEILSSERQILADLIRIEGRDSKVFSGEGNVEIEDFSRDMRLEAQSFFYDEEAELLRIEGQAVLEDRESLVLVKCQRLDYDQDADVVIIQRNVRIFKDDILCRAEYAVFRRAEDILELSGSPLVYKGEDQYQADRITVNLETDEITMFGEIQGVMTTESDDDSAEDEPQDEELPQEEVEDGSNS